MAAMSGRCLFDPAAGAPCYEGLDVEDELVHCVVARVGSSKASLSQPVQRRIGVSTAWMSAMEAPPICRDFRFGLLARAS